MRRMKIPMVCVVLVLPTMTWARNVIYVDDDAPVGGDGTSWQTAYRFLQDGLAVAQMGDEIRVAQGVYKPDCSSLTPEGSGDREVSFGLKSGLTLNGGYTGLTGSDPNAWDAELYQTVLSGDLAGDDVLEADPCDLVAGPNEGFWRRPGSLTYWCLLIESTRKENSLHVVDASGASEHKATLDGFTISGGQAFDPPYWLSDVIRFDSNDYGGGIFNQGGNLCLHRCLIKENASIGEGPGIYNHGGSLELIDCSLTSNYSHYSGQCLLLEDSEVLIKGCLFEEYFPYPRRSGARGWIGCAGSDLTVANCQFLNHAELDHGATINLVNCTAAFDQCVFFGHREGVIFASQSSLDIAKCRFNDNKRGDGAAILLYSGNSVKVESSVFSGNRGGQGGAIYSGGSTLEVKHCVFSGNYSNQRAGAILCGADITTIDNSIFMGNWAPTGSDIYAYSDTILSYNCLESFQGIAFEDSNKVMMKIGNLLCDPCFVDPGYWDSNGTPDNSEDDFYVAGDYHLKSQAGHWDPNSESWICDEVTSPCIDAGDPNTPIMYEPFPNGGRINMGAYGGTIEASKSYFGCSPCEIIIAGDVNGDCKVNYLDLAILASHWLERGENDFNSF